MKTLLRIEGIIIAVLINYTAWTEIVFNVPFENPPHQIGQSPVCNCGPSCPSEVFGFTMITNNIAGFTSQVAMVVENEYSGIGFYPGQVFSNGIVKLSWDLAVAEADPNREVQAYIHIEGPGSQDLFVSPEYRLDGRIYLRGYGYIGSYTINYPSHLSLTLDFEAPCYSVSLDGVPVVSASPMDPGKRINLVSLLPGNYVHPIYVMDNFLWEWNPQPEAVVFAPWWPRDCEQLLITYNPAGRLLSNASPVYMTISFDGWANHAHHRMTPSDDGKWWYTNVIPAGARLASVNFRDLPSDAPNLLDNNIGSNWMAAILPCYEIVITNPAAEFISVYQSTSNFNLMGFCRTSAWVGLNWTNSLTSGEGIMPAGYSWAISNLALGLGTNIITVTATNRGPILNSAWDSATNASYDDSWLDGDNAGEGWGPWNMVAANAGWYIASNEFNLNIGPKAWALWANTYATVQAIRPFLQPMGIGQVLSLKFDNNWVQNGYSVGIGMQNTNRDNLFEFMFIGGGSNYIVNDQIMTRDTHIPWIDQGWDLSFELISASTYRFACGTNVITGALKNVPDQQIARFYAWDYGGGKEREYHFYLNDLHLTRMEYSGPSTSDMVRIIRTDQTSSIPQEWRGRYGLAGEGGLDEEDRDGDGQSNLREYWSDTNPNDPWSFFDRITSANARTGSTSGIILDLGAGPTTTNSRLYDAYWSTGLQEDGWSALGMNVPGHPTGSPVTLTVTNQADPQQYYRAGVKMQ